MTPKMPRVAMAALTAAVYLVKLARLLLLAEILLFFGATGLSYFKDAREYKGLAKVMDYQALIERPAALAVKQVMPTNFKGTDISRWLFVLLVYVLSTVLGRADDTMEERVEYLKRRGMEADAEGLEGLEQSLRALSQGEKLDRKKLLQIYAEAKKTLENQKRHVAFVCIDIVNSTGMKIGESAEVAERDFVLYRKMVEKHLKTFRALKATWTPDGVMICFDTAKDAVMASQAILLGMEEFNRKVKAIKHDFALRIGVNAGEVSYDDTIPMEEMTDRVIDITGHMQKHGTIDAVCVTEEAIKPLLSELPYFRATDRVVDGCKVYEWQPQDAKKTSA